jgi:ribosomal protein S12 methylthiotransferase accessory factor
MTSPVVVFLGPTLSPGDARDVLDRLRGAGVEQAILVDLTRPDVAVPVVRMVVPGLEGWTDKVAAAVPGPRRRALRET